MKKVILLFSVLAFTFSSCSGDDDAQDSFIGTWTYHQSFLNDVEEVIDNCDKQDTLVVNSDGTYSSTTYFTQSDGTCVLDDTTNGTWENIGNSTYRIIADGDTDDVKIIFENNTFYTIDIDGSDTYKDVYIRN